jgi:hypothetical protein
VNSSRGEARDLAESDEISPALREIPGSDPRSTHVEKFRRCIRSANRGGSSPICADRDRGFDHAIAVLQVSMRLTTLMELLEREIGASPSARSKLALMVAERGQKESAAGARGGASQPSADGGARKRSTSRAG